MASHLLKPITEVRKETFAGFYGGQNIDVFGDFCEVSDTVDDRKRREDKYEEGRQIFDRICGRDKDRD